MPSRTSYTERFPMAHKEEYYYLMRLRKGCMDKEMMDAIGDDLLGLARLPYEWPEGTILGSVVYELISKAEFETYKEFDITKEISFNLDERK